MCAKARFQSIMGTRERRDALAVEQPRPITAADFDKMVDSRRERTRAGLGPGHRPQQPWQAPLDCCLPELGLVVSDGSRPLAPAIRPPHVGPQGRRVIETALEDRLQASELLGPAPLFSTRSQLSAIAVRRSWSLSPEAAQGGRPSSVRALRTALQ